MSNSTKPFMTFKEAFMSVYLPGILVFLGVIACATCVSVGPFFPVGVAGIIAVIALIWIAVSLIKGTHKIQNLKDTIDAEEARIASINKRHASDLARKDAIITELNDTILVLQNKINTLQDKVKELESANQKPNDKDNPVELPEPTVKPEVKKKTSKKK